MDGDGGQLCGAVAGGGGGIIVEIRKGGELQLIESVASAMMDFPHFFDLFNLFSGASRNSICRLR